MIVNRLWLTGMGATIIAATVFACSSSSDSSSSTDDNDASVEASAIDTGPDVAFIDAATPCDPVAQNCADPSAKCTVIASGSDRVARCVGPGSYAWTETEGQACNRASEGDDDCIKGLGCLPNGSDTDYACTKFCALDSQCGAGGKCAATTTLKPYIGNCFKACDAFSDLCGDGGSCASIFEDNDGVNTVQTCRSLGVGAAGASCDQAWDCQANLVCYGSSGFKCSSQCDSTHSCGDAGSSCTQLAGLANQAGVCQ